MAFCRISRFSGDPDLKTQLVPEGFTGLGSEQTARIWYQALAFMHGYAPPVTFLNAREASLDGATALYGKYSAQRKAVEDAFAAIRVGSPADRTPPTITFTSKQLSRTNAEVVVDITDPDNVQPGSTVVITSRVNPDVTITQPCAAGHCVVTVDPTELGHGTHTVLVTATDVPNNTVTQIFNLSLDLQGPAVAFTDLTRVSHEPYAYNRRYRVIASDPSLVAAARLSLDGTEVKAWSFLAPSVTVPETWVLIKTSPDGLHEVALEAKDALGNVTTKTHSFFRERVPPSLCTLTTTVDPSNWMRVNLAMTSSDARSGIYQLAVYVDNQYVDSLFPNSLPTAVVASSMKTAALPEGEHRIVVKCIDGQRNEVNSPERTVFLGPPCNTTATAGTNQVSTKTFNMGAGSGTVQLIFRTFVVHDRIRVMGANNAVVADTGCAATGSGGYRSQTVTFSGTRRLTVQVNPNCDPVTAAPTTEWDYRLTCP